MQKNYDFNVNIMYSNYYGMIYLFKQEMNESERGRKKRRNDEDDDVDDIEEFLGVRKKFQRKKYKI